MIAFDIESTGIDTRHGAMPFFVGICDDKGSITYWEWDVDPKTRKVTIPKKDILEIKRALHKQKIVGQNIRFDVTSMSEVDPYFRDWDWDNTDDTLIAGHLLASGQPHDLTTMALVYLNYDIQPLEHRLRDCVKDCRNWVRSEGLDWAIAKEGREDMPSAGDEVWGFDFWLPRAVAQHCDYKKPKETCDHKWTAAEPVCKKCKGHLYWVALSEYSNTDTSTTLPLWQVQEQKIKARNLWNIYMETRKILRTTFLMQNNGVTYSQERADHLTKHYGDVFEDYGRVCTNLATNMGYDLKMPKGAAPNNSIRGFLYDHLKLPKVITKKAAKSAAAKGRDPNPSLDKDVMQEYLLTTMGKPLLFLKRYDARKKRATRISYMKAYKRYALEIKGQTSHRRLYGNFNPTGTATLRFSSNNPNCQNWGKHKDEDGYSLKYCFGPMPGREWWSLDFKNIELRIPAYESGEEDLIFLFERPNDPPYFGSEHILNFSAVYPDLWAQAIKAHGLENAARWIKSSEGYKSTWYQWVKNGDFAIQYGAGDGTADAAFHKLGARKLLIARFQKKEALNRKYIKDAHKYGYVETIPDKTIDPERGYPLQCSRGDRNSISPTIPLAYHVSSTAMHLTRKGMNRCQARIEEWNDDGFDGNMVLQVHDELVFDFPKAADPRVDPNNSNLWRAMELKALMEMGGEELVIRVPSPVGVEWHPDNFNESVVFA